MSKPRRRFTPEFKTQVVELLSTGKPVSEVAREFGIGTNVLYRWKQALEAGILGRSGGGR